MLIIFKRNRLCIIQNPEVSSTRSLPPLSPTECLMPDDVTMELERGLQGGVDLPLNNPRPPRPGVAPPTGSALVTQ